MAKVTPLLYNVHFNKLDGDVAFEMQARLIEIDLEGSNARPYMHIERKGNEWLILHGGAMGAYFPNALVLEFIRKADDRWLRNVATDRFYPTKNLTKLNINLPLFHFDRLGTEAETWRITFSDGLLDTSAVLTSISFTRRNG